jgi:cellulose synthase/poly-beta-1,6-N-acetylglucosamine synthase-like glycosyltransferase
MVEGLIETLSQFNYPQDKLEIFFLCEEVDPETITAVQKHLKPPFHLHIVPKGLPQTKPRALNYALQFAKGEFVTIYDAEDRPHPDQLWMALDSFEANPNWTTLQAPLDYYNTDDNLLTRQFTLEYAALFHVWLPFLARLGIPFPLGGTSNHMRRSALDECEGWDAHNVTEDADLSFRLATLNQKIGYITPPTDEEAVSGLKMWHNQRARWMKGYVQTWLVHMHRPLRPLNVYGVARFLSLQLTLAYSVLSALIYTPVLVGGLVYIMGYWAFDWRMPFSAPYFFALGLSLSVGILIGMVGAYRAGKPQLLKWALLMPVYWVLLFWPTVRALTELHTRRFYWHKTDHGVSPSRVKNDLSIVETKEHAPAE